jgi:hypothetical protein
MKKFVSIVLSVLFVSVAHSSSITSGNQYFQTQVFTVSGTWVVPDNVSRILVSMSGGGGVTDNPLGPPSAPQNIGIS